MKKIVSLLVAFMMLLTGTTYASAADIQDDEPKQIGSYVMNEYDALVEAKKSITNSTANSTSIEDLLLSRAQLSDEILKQMYDYTEEQIAILKSYDGSPIEENPQLKGLFADLEGTIFKVSSNDHGVTVRFSWSWTKPPLNWGNDNVTCAWVGVNSNNGPHALRYDSSRSSCYIKYYDVLNDSYQYQTQETIDDTHPDSDVSVNFDLNNLNNQNIWAKAGNITVAINEPVATNDLQYSTVVFGYGHDVVTLSASFSVSKDSISISITPQHGTEEMYNGSISLWTNGKIEMNGDAA